MKYEINETYKDSIVLSLPNRKTKIIIKRKENGVETFEETNTEVIDNVLGEDSSESLKEEAIEEVE